MLSVRVPPDFRSPFPPGWSAEENALAIGVGVEAVKRSRPNDGSVDASKRELEGTLRQLLSDRKPLEDEIARLGGELRSERELRAADAEAARARAREKVREEVREEIRELTQGLEARAQSAEQELRLERDAQRQLARLHEADARDRAAHQQQEARRVAHLMQQTEEKASRLEAALCEKQEALARLSVAANKGSAVERELNDALRDTGLHTVDTSKGAFNTHYHDILVGAHPLHETPDVSPVPRYEADEPSPRCSLESKAHSRSGSIGAEREKFAQVRRRLMEGRRAECFVFAARTAIPGQLRWHFEFVRVGGRHCVTGYVGASDVGANEVCLMVQLVLKLQERLDREILVSHVPSDATLAEFVEHATESLHGLREQIVRCDQLDKIVQSLRDETKALRASAVASLMAQTRLLSSTGFPPTDDALADVREAHTSLSTTRLSNCKILRNKDQFAAARVAVAASSAAARKRPRDDSR